MWAEAGESRRDRVDQGVEGSGRSLAQKRFELGEELLDRIEVRRIGRQIEQPCAGEFDRLAYRGQLVL